MRSTQQRFGGKSFQMKKPFGGSHLKGNPKTIRPFSSQVSMHVVLRVRDARGMRSLLAHGRRVEEIVGKQARQSYVRLYDMANAGNHLHLHVRARAKVQLTAFLRAIGGLIAREVIGTERGKARNGKLNAFGTDRVNSEQKEENFWQGRPFSGLVPGEIFKKMGRYFMQNRLDLVGMARATSRRMLAQVEELQKSGVLNLAPA